MDIDIVVLWVDGSDPEWQIEKAKYSSRKLDDTNSVNRFRDWGLMPYWFRAVENYIPWVRTIHFVTCGQVPSFLKLDHPKLHFVTHREFMPEDCLPTFNSCAIEMNIHRIEGLAEHFLYMNDDTFIGRPLKPETFFKNGLPCINGSEQIIPPINTTETARHMAINDIGVINDHFKKKCSSERTGESISIPATACETISRLLPYGSPIPIILSASRTSTQSASVSSAPRRQAAASPTAEPRQKGRGGSPPLFPCHSYTYKNRSRFILFPYKRCCADPYPG